MVGNSATLEKDKLFEAKQANALYFRHCYVLPAFSLPQTDLTGSDDSAVCQERCRQLSRSHGFHSIFAEDILHEMAADETCPFATYLRNCFNNKIDPHLSLVIDALERKMENASSQKTWCLVRGFPQHAEQLKVFQREVSSFLGIEPEQR